MAGRIIRDVDAGRVVVALCGPCADGTHNNPPDGFTTCQCVEPTCSCIVAGGKPLPPHLAGLREPRDA